MNGRSLKERPQFRHLQRQDEEENEELEDEKKQQWQSSDEVDWSGRRFTEDIADMRQSSEEDETNDYVFRILSSIKPEKMSKFEEWSEGKWCMFFIMLPK